MPLRAWIHFCVYGAACLFVASASAASPDAVYAQWKRLRDPASVGIRFEEAAGFVRAHPQWPQQNVIRMRAEAAALLVAPNDPQMREFCKDFPPISGRGMVACARAGWGDVAAQRAAIRQAWKQGDFSAIEEKEILRRYPQWIDAALHRARLDRLLYEQKLTAARRMLAHVPPTHRLLAEARMALQADGRDVVAKLHNVPAALRGDAGLLLDRLEWRARHGQAAGVRELLFQAPKDAPYADRWWRYRAVAVREALKVKRPKEALQLLMSLKHLSAEPYADGLFLRGWIRLRRLGDPRAAYEDFYALYHGTQTPVSKARGAYWAGRAALKNGNPEIAKGWFKKAAAYPLVFYGQLAAQQLATKAPLTLPQDLAVTEEGRRAVASRLMPSLVVRLVAAGDRPMANLFIAQLADEAKTPWEAAAIAEFLTAQGDRHGGVKLAKQALRKNFSLVAAGWPRIGVPKGLPIEPSLTLAIARQESEFYSRANSSADARGLMQLLPSTGAQVAKKIGMAYGTQTLWRPESNLTLGSTYLGQLIAGFDGSYVLAIASYNAGPSNVRKWIATYGMPPANLEGSIDWIEQIPFAETRNYVMRVLENVQIYRAQAQPQRPLRIAEDLLR